jgi:hypothetical protein
MDPAEVKDSDKLPAEEQLALVKKYYDIVDASSAEGPQPIATPVFDGATQVEVDEALMGWALAHADRAGDPLSVKMPISLDNNPGTRVAGK